MNGAYDTLDTPEALKALAADELPALAAALRAQILSNVARTGGHLASSLGAVELSIALARVFAPATDRIVWDVGHQTYAWKMLTGRRAAMGTIRQHGGLSGFCAPEESPCDAFVSGHAGIAFAVAEGLAVARDQRGETHQVVAVVGDASFGNGETFEALDSCAQLTRKMIVVLNDNGMSISRNTGAMARFLGRLISGLRYNRIKKAAEATGHRLRLTFLRGLYHRVESYIKSIWLGNVFFERYGLRYVGPVDGHNLAALEAALTVAKEEDRSVLVHVVTVKGRGFPPAERDPSRWHGVGPFDLAAVRAGAEAASSGGADWSAVFGEALCACARDDARICALTAAMRDGTGLGTFAAQFPTRFYDVGICESQLVSMAAGLAKGGMRPVVAVYSSFLQRAIDQVMHDVCLLNLPVILAIDRAGCVGADGRTHHGLFDLAMLRSLPNLTIAQPKDAAELAQLLRLALEIGGPWAIRYPRGVPRSLPSAEKSLALVRGVAEPLGDADAPIQIWALGDAVATACDVVSRLAEKGCRAGVVNARFVKPLDTALLQRHLAAGVQLVTIENAALAGGFGATVAETVAAWPGRTLPLMRFGWPDEFIAHGPVDVLAREQGLAADQIAERIFSSVSRQ